MIKIYYFLPIHHYCLFLSVHHYRSRFPSFHLHHWIRRTHITYLRKSLEPFALRKRCVMTRHFLAMYFKSLWDFNRFLPITLWPCKQATLSKRNFKTGTATKEYNTPLEKPLLGLCNELSLHSVGCSVLPLGGAKHSTKFCFN